MDPRSPAEPSRRRFPSWLPQTLGYCVSLACLVWVLHDFPLRKLSEDIRTIDWKWVSLAVVADLSVYVCHGWRWNVLLRPLIGLRLWRTVQAIYIGLFANEVLPLRTGEVIRCYLLAHWNTLQLSVAFASAGLERIIDGIWMVIAFLITSAYLSDRMPGQLVFLVQVVAGLLVVGVAILVWLVFHKQHAHSVIKESKWAAALRHIVEGLHLMGNRTTLIQTSLVSLVYLVLQILSVWFLMKAYRFDLSFWVAAGVLTVVRFGTVIPNAPGNVGLFQAACVLALGLFDVEPNDAKSFSVLMFVALTLPLLIGGAVAVAMTGLNIGQLRTQAQQSARDAAVTDVR